MTEAIDMDARRAAAITTAVQGMGRVEQSFKAWMKNGTSPAALHAVRRREQGTA